MSTPAVEPLSFKAWCSSSNVESRYEAFHGEYGDAACLLSDYKDAHYQEYLDTFKRDAECSLWPYGA